VTHRPEQRGPSATISRNVEHILKMDCFIFEWSLDRESKPLLLFFGEFSSAFERRRHEVLVSVVYGPSGIAVQRGAHDDAGAGLRALLE
jgi:hypothetical protein